MCVRTSSRHNTQFGRIGVAVERLDRVLLVIACVSGLPRGFKTPPVTISLARCCSKNSRRFHWILPFSRRFFCSSARLLSCARCRSRSRSSSALALLLLRKSGNDIFFWVVAVLSRFKSCMAANGANDNSATSLSDRNDTDRLFLGFSLPFPLFSCNCRDRSNSLCSRSFSFCRYHLRVSCSLRQASNSSECFSGFRRAC
mmetsp:Transcript_21302/g.40470  ORF Transcript_21302/g.40470 Transcript_21302/m.40470 type:complete len:200 (+) Transcript_21302:140-739(+)